MTIEEALYELGQDWLPDDLQVVICKTIIRLPLDVQDFALRRCTYISYDNQTHGQCFPASTFTHLTRGGRTMRNHWVIMLHGSVAKRKNGQFTVAHEIAHACLKHPILCADLLGEEKADLLVESWGFKVPAYRGKVHAEHRSFMESPAAIVTEGGAAK